ncbi:hypothetical protein MMC11_003911 [Xylographa trunciseda]|nr:hypothetical protein [Xylographa trunciseda]
MSSGPSGRPVVQLPLIETNPHRRRRAIWWKARKLRLWGYPAALYSIVRRAPLESLMHWAVEIGPWLHELHTDEGKNGHLMRNRLHRSQMWCSEIGERTIGYTSCTDREIDGLAEAVLIEMKSFEKSQGEYDRLLNNCQVFVALLADRLDPYFLDLPNMPWSNVEWRIMRILRQDIRGQRIEESREADRNQQVLLLEKLYSSERNGIETVDSIMATSEASTNDSHEERDVERSLDLIFHRPQMPLLLEYRREAEGAGNTSQTQDSLIRQEPRSQDRVSRNRDRSRDRSSDRSRDRSRDRNHDASRDSYFTRSSGSMQRSSTESIPDLMRRVKRKERRKFLKATAVVIGGLGLLGIFAAKRVTRAEKAYARGRGGIFQTQ